MIAPSEPILFQLVRSLSKTERSQLARYLDCPLHNGQVLPRALFKAIRNQQPDTPEKRKRLYRKLRPDGVYDARQQARDFDTLARLVEKFLVWRETESQPELHLQLLQRSLARRGVSGRFERVSSELEKKLQSSPHGAARHLQLHLSADERLSHFHTVVPDEKVKYFRACTQALDRFYLHKRLLIECELANLTDIYREKKLPDLPYLTDALIELLPVLDTEPQIAYLHQILRQLHQPGTPGGMVYLQTHRTAFFERLDPREARFVTLLLIKVALREYLRLRSPDTLQFMLALYEEALRRAYLLVDGRISTVSYFNILLLILESKDNARADQFVARYAPMLDATTQENSAFLAKAYLAFAEGHYADAERYLLQYSRINKPLVMQAYRLELQTLYERWQTDPEAFPRLRNRLRAYRAWLNDDRPDRPHALRVNRDKQLLGIFQQLISVQRQPDEELAKNLLRDIRSQPQLPLFNWLVEKAAHLIKIDVNQ